MDYGNGQEGRISNRPTTGKNDPFQFTAWQGDGNVYTAQNWTFIESVVNGMAYGVDKYDLGNEEIYNSPPADSFLATYTNWIWTQWYNTYGLTSYPGNNTVGFSVPCDDFCVDKLGLLDATYDVNGVIRYPPALDLHIYGSDCPGQTTSMTAAQQYTAAINYLAPNGHTANGFILGEACYNSAGPPEGLRNAATATGTNIWYITQWVAPFGTTEYLYGAWSFYGF
jgi:hypothetical protein